MAGSAVRVAFLADTKDLRQNLAKAEQSLKDVGDTADAAGKEVGRGLESVAEASDGVASASSQAAGGLGDLGGALSLMPGPLGAIGTGMESLAPAIMGVTGAADLMNLATEKFPKLARVSTKATNLLAKAKRGLGLAVRFAMGPVGLIIAGLALLVGGLILAYKKSETFRKIVNAGFAAVKAVVSKVLPPVRAIVVNVFTAIKTYLSAVFKIYKTLFSGAWSAIKTMTGAAFRGVKDYIVRPLGDVVAFIRGIPGKITALGVKFKDAGRFIIQKMIDGISNAAGFVSGIAGKVWDAVKGLLNSAIDKINSALEFTIKIPAAPDITINPPNIPHLAKGGIVTRPTLALIGEAGPEAVVPLDGRHGMGNVYAITVQVAPGADLVEAGRQMTRAIDAYERAGGRRAS